jgi:hypothetical protein
MLNEAKTRGGAVPTMQGKTPGVMTRAQRERTHHGTAADRRFFFIIDAISLSIRGSRDDDTICRTVYESV